MAEDGETAGDVPSGLPPALADALDGYVRHLRSERGMSENSVRAYRGDVATLLEHARRMGRTVPAAFDLLVLRSWLAGQSSRGMSRSTLARRAAAARGFTAWALRDGLVEKDVGALLATPRSGRTLPGVLRRDEADALLVVSRTADAKTGKLKPALIVVPTDAKGLQKQVIPMDFHAPEKQFTLFFDDVRVPADALVGDEDGGIWQLFAGLNPERIMGAAFSNGMARFALDKAVEYAKTRKVWKDVIGTHQGIAHPLAKAKIELEQSRLLMQKAAALYDAGDDAGAGEFANMAKYAGGEVACNTLDVAVHTHGGNGLAQEYGLGNMLLAARLGRIAPVSREMILNFVAMHSLGLPKSY
ncbi:MAG: acyl-CoA dehydrogenase family protein [Solirubrobacteraceae bacterium]